MSAITWIEANVFDAQNQTNNGHTDLRYFVNLSLGPTITAKISLTTINHADEQSSFAADAFILYYVQNGEHKSGPVPFVWGENITEVVFRLAVNGCYARALWEVDYMQP